MTKENGQPPKCIELVTGQLVYYLTDVESNEPRNTKQDRRYAVVYGEGVEVSILGLKRKETAPTFVAVVIGW